MSATPKPGRAPFAAVLVLAAAALAAAAWLLLETQDLARAAGEQEVAARGAAAACAEAKAEAARERERAERAEAGVLRLEGELQAAQGRVQAMAAALEERTEAEAEERARREAERAAAATPIPEGVRHCLAALHECLVADGFSSFRFVRASALDGEGLHDVELLVTDPDGFGTSLFTAERVTVALERAEAKATLRLFRGSQSANGVVTRLPADGLPFVVKPVTTRAWEQRLPYLVTAKGQEPAAAAAAPPPADEMEPSLRAKWLERLDGLLAGAGTQHTLRVQAFRKLDGGRFLDAHVRGYDDKRHLAMTADCDDLAIEVDATANIVSLVLRGGTLIQPGGRSAIAAEGYRMLLPKVTPENASTAMLGMVVKK